jgi:hypothetical protein
MQSEDCILLNIRRALRNSSDSWDYLLSSARDYNGSKGLLPIEHLTAAYTLVR